MNRKTLGWLLIAIGILPMIYYVYGISKGTFGGDGVFMGLGIFLVFAIAFSITGLALIKKSKQALR